MKKKQVKPEANQVWQVPKTPDIRIIVRVGPRDSRGEMDAVRFRELGPRTLFQHRDQWDAWAKKAVLIGRYDPGVS